MKVSIVIITYNQEKYIAQAIESVLMQKVNFDYEIVIGDDCSNDRTREIVIEYQKKYPDKIRPLLAEKNYGDYGRTNFIRSLKACTGEYIALLDGDDYWTRDCKLQWQADFLDNHPDCSTCFHFFSTLNDNGKRRIFYPPGLKRRYTLKTLLLNNFIGSSTVMFRRDGIRELPQWYYESQIIGDWPLHVLNAQRGDLGCIRRFLAIKRVHSGGLYSRLDTIQQIKGSMASRQFVNKQLNLQYDKVFQRYDGLSYLNLAKEYIAMGDREKAREYLIKCVRRLAFYRIIFSEKFLIVLLKLYFPWSLSFLAASIRSIQRAILRLKFKIIKGSSPF